MKIIGKIFASVYSTILTLVMIAFLMLFFAQSVISKEFIASALKSFDFSEVTVKEFGLEDYVQKYGEDATVEDAILSELEAAGIDKEAARKVINDDNIKDFVADKASEIIEAVSEEKNVTLVTEAEIRDALQNLDLTNEDYASITDFLNEVITEFNKEVKNGSNN